MLFKTFWRKKVNQQDKATDIVNQFDNFKYKTSVETRFADFDMMGHVNNATYFTYMEVAREKYWKQAVHCNWTKSGVVVARASMDYIVPVLPEDRISVYVRTSRIGNTSFDLEYLFVKMKGNEEVVCSKGKTVCVAFNYQQRTAVPIPENERNKMILFEQLG
jgi:acyl-CoA thioester hydrolase